MPKEIRIPNKVLIIGTLLTVIFAVSITAVGDRLLFNLGHSLESRGYAQASGATLETLAALYPNSELSAESLVHLARKLPPQVDVEEFLYGSTEIPEATPGGTRWWHL